jgi:hypothetical protein
MNSNPKQQELENIHDLGMSLKGTKSSHQHVSCLMKAVISMSAAWQTQLTSGLSTKFWNTSVLST